jgi:hypothetical protein
MNPSAAAAMTAKIVLTALGAAATGLGLTSTAMAQSPPFNTDLSIDELMEAIVMPDANVIWNAVVYDATEDGEVMTGPKTDDEWLAVRHAALALVEVTNNLMIPGRHANVEGAEAGYGELAPSDIEALIAKEPDTWNAYAMTLRAVAMQAVEAIDARDAEKIFVDTGGALDEACEACHKTFWYPDQ